MGIGGFFKRLLGKRKPEGIVTDFGSREMSRLQFQNNPSAWRNDPAMKPRFTEEKYPDDLQVVVHEGGYRNSTFSPELIWVRVTGKSGICFKGLLMNQPLELPTLKANDEILFMAANGGQFPHLITAKYIRERADWAISPCDKCGMHEMFDAPSDFLKVAFSNIGEDMEMEGFTTFCNFCKGVQVVSKV